METIDDGSMPELSGCDKPNSTQKRVLSDFKKMTVDELAEFCRTMEGMAPDDCVKLGKSRGICKNNIYVLRFLLGMTAGKPAPIPEETKEQLRQAYEDDPDITGYQLAKKFNMPYQVVYQLLSNMHCDTNRKRDTWSVHKIKALLVARDKEHIPWTEIPRRINVPVSTNACQQMYYVLVRPNLYPERGIYYRHYLKLPQADGFTWTDEHEKKFTKWKKIHGFI